MKKSIKTSIMLLFTFFAISIYSSDGETVEITRNEKISAFKFDQWSKWEPANNSSTTEMKCRKVWIIEASGTSTLIYNRIEYEEYSNEVKKYEAYLKNNSNHGTPEQSFMQKPIPPIPLQKKWMRDEKIPLKTIEVPSQYYYRKKKLSYEVPDELLNRAPQKPSTCIKE